MRCVRFACSWLMAGVVVEVGALCGLVGGEVEAGVVSFSLSDNGDEDEGVVVLL